ncbi:hypothetical protein HPP92_003505 [Vanilla planifolia]|uniref:Exonuclease domain-containing protein n=1 Tax=Vanilla planifolia TaxID=51239 RepID=A0A835SGT3_VANPL|nr:hypothetical protein HPP92_003898 [Vanilla planifolia]KAG0503433.1 hypothetical protein HPP92_003505 [Vanilla planifolia]
MYSVVRRILFPASSTSRLLRRMTLARFSFPLSLLRSNVFSPSLHANVPPSRKLAVSASLSSMNSAALEEASCSKGHRWKPMCLYFTQGKCTKMDEKVHLEKFNHNLSMDLQPNAFDQNNLRPQNMDYLLVLDLEGKIEILEFPVVMIEAKTLKFIDLFHRFVRPTGMNDQRVAQYVEGKYGKFGVDRVWHDTAIPFRDVLEEFETWMTNHQLWKKGMGASLNHAAFVTCGNWDLKTKVPQQCKISKIRTPSYFMEWINLKDIYLNFYHRRATGMMTMMRELDIRLSGSHHLGIDDTINIARVLQRLLVDGLIFRLP